MKIKFLGTAAGLPDSDRYNASILLETGGSSYLIDAGEPCSATLYAGGYNMFSIKTVFISHAHPDHIGGLPQFLSVINMCLYPEIKYRFKACGSYKLDLYLPEDSIKVFKDFCDMTIGLSGLQYDLDIIPIKQGMFFKDDKLSVSALPNTHLQNKCFKSKTSYCFSFKCKGKHIVYTGDIGKTDDIIPLLNDKIDLLITEGAHIRLDGLFKLLSKADIGKVVVTHFHPELYGQEQKILELGNKYLNCELLVAEDNLTVSLEEKDV